MCETGNAIKVQKVQETTSQRQSTLSSSSASTFSFKGAKQKSYCWCRGADDGNMVGCDGCFDWFHSDYIETRMGLGKIERIHRSKKYQRWYCENCKRKD